MFLDEEESQGNMMKDHSDASVCVCSLFWLLTYRHVALNDCRFAPICCSCWQPLCFIVLKVLSKQRNFRCVLKRLQGIPQENTCPLEHPSLRTTILQNTVPQNTIPQENTRPSEHPGSFDYLLLYKSFIFLSMFCEKPGKVNSMSLFWNSEHQEPPLRVPKSLLKNLKKRRSHLTWLLAVDLRSWASSACFPQMSPLSSPILRDL